MAKHPACPDLAKPLATREQPSPLSLRPSLGLFLSPGHAEQKEWLPEDTPQVDVCSQRPGPGSLLYKPVSLYIYVT